MQSGEFFFKKSTTLFICDTEKSTDLKLVKEGLSQAQIVWETLLQSRMLTLPVVIVNTDYGSKYYSIVVAKQLLYCLLFLSV